jgi:GNAT superfamily N-acetyltransferase
MRIRPIGQPGDLGWVVMAHGEVYVHELGWDTSFEALVARIVADFAAQHDPAREAAWIAEHDGGRRAGCIFCVADPDDPAVAKLRVLLVHTDARGHDLGGRLVDECVAFARRAGYERMRLWTTASLDAARRVYVKRGFRLIEEEPPRALFGIDFVAQTYELEL